ncbi:MAG: MFS transporter [Pseudomonas sp.]|uniref:MFS transporter n=1 Tax=Pseudomonas abieticivorans TaxID=2931382 RepID=UPI0020BFB25D|nr:MFS transporter [Pseudomonas sp. PIA16]MDE1164575.1 MFS transporter [Pseudomonas sp.]
MRFILFSLALAAFAIGTTEFAPMGLLPVIASGVGVSIPSAGMLISAYAVGVMVGAPLMTLLLSPARRKTALLLLMAIFTVGNVLSAFAPGYASLLFSRVFTSMAHGAFFGLGSVVAASLVAKEKQAGAVATMFLGLTIANIGGVPVATWIGQLIGWRAAFFATAGLGVLAMVSLAFALPRGEKGQMPEVRRELRVLMRPQVLRALLTTVLGAGAMFTLYTYIASVLQHLTHATPTFVTAMLVVIGIGFTLGNLLSGKLAERSLEGTLMGFLGVLAVIMLAFPFIATTSPGAAITLLLWGAATFGAVPPLQMRVMHAAHDAPGMASSVNIGAFNLGNALGAAVGGGVLGLGLGYEWIAPAGGVLALAGLLLTAANRSPAAATGAAMAQ